MMAGVDATGLPDDAGMLRVHVDPDRCAGSGDCVLRLATHFVLREDGISGPTGAPVDAAVLSVLREVVRDCPTQAITIDGFA
jgi:ferredoxin